MLAPVRPDDLAALMLRTLAEADAATTAALVGLHLVAAAVMIPAPAVPVVVLTTSDAGGPLEIVTDGRTGLVTSPDAAALAAAAGRLRANPADAKAYGQAGHELACGRLDHVRLHRAVASSDAKSPSDLSCA